MDEHVPEAITAGLRRRGIDVIVPEEDGHDGQADNVLLDRATEPAELFSRRTRTFSLRLPVGNAPATRFPVCFTWLKVD
jgi:hypothetical protein